MNSFPVLIRLFGFNYTSNRQRPLKSMSPNNSCNYRFYPRDVFRLKTCLETYLSLLAIIVEKQILREPHSNSRLVTFS